jgi:hypothetical protein
MQERADGGKSHGDAAAIEHAGTIAQAVVVC